MFKDQPKDQFEDLAKDCFWGLSKDCFEDCVYSGDPETLKFSVFQHEMIKIKKKTIQSKKSY